MAAVIPF